MQILELEAEEYIKEPEIEEEPKEKEENNRREGSSRRARRERPRPSLLALFFVRSGHKETKAHNNKDKQKEPKHVSVSMLSHEPDRLRRHTVPVLFRPLSLIFSKGLLFHF